jgi:PAS domain S-box-containing protein
VARPPHVPQSETELEEFFDLSIDPLSIIGFDGEFKRVNASFLRLLGYTKPELFSRTAVDILHPDDAGAAREALAQVAEGHDLVGFEARVICADGSVRWLEWNTRSVPERGVVYSVGRDTTERRRVEAELREAQRLLEGSRDELRVLADEQAALRRVATLVAQDVPARELFGAVADEVGVLLGADLGGMIRYEEDGTVTTVAAWAAAAEHPRVPNVNRIGAHWDREPGDPAAIIEATREPARVDDWTSVPGSMATFMRNVLGVSSSVACPIVVEGRLWGALAVHSKESRPLPPDTESRIAQFTDLVGTAIANAESRGRADRLAEEQAALRRVATLVAKEASPAEVFAKVAEEVANLLGEVECALLRDEGDGTASTVAAWGAGMSAHFPVGTRVPTDREGVLAFALREGRPRRIDDYSAVDEPAAEVARDHGIGSAVGLPIVVGGGIWGAIVAVSFGAEPCPPETESHIARFADLVATAIANAETRAEVERLADEQAALRRVATLIARGMGPEQVFQAVADEVQALLDADASGILRFEADGTVTVMGANGGPYGPGARLELDPDFIVGAVRRTGRAARFDTDDPAGADMPEVIRAGGMRSAVAHPILVEGGVWGAIAVGSGEGPMPAVAEGRLAGFTELVATAVANTDAREQVTALAEEQAALRRVATLVAEGAEPAAVFEAVAAETQALIGADGVSLSRYEPAEHVVVVAHTGANAARVPPGTRLNHEGHNLTSIVRRTERPARLEQFGDLDGAIGELAEEFGVGASVGVPIVVDGRLWGATIAIWMGDASPPPDTEARMSQFAGLLDTAIANADSRDQLTASRARLVTAGDEARRRVVRDLHDGGQQRLMHAIVTLKLAQRAFREGDGKAESLVGEALGHAQQGHEELRELAHGILPAVLTRGGLRAGVDALVTRLDLPVHVEVPVDRFQAEIEASAYFIVAEALTNVVKHSHATRAEVRASVGDGLFRIDVRDDGSGGADPEGHGLVGMNDRVTALGGRLRIESPKGGGTRVTATLPLSTPPREPRSGSPTNPAG